MIQVDPCSVRIVAADAKSLIHSRQKVSGIYPFSRILGITGGELLLIESFAQLIHQLNRYLRIGVCVGRPDRADDELKRRFELASESFRAIELRGGEDGPQAFANIAVGLRKG